MSFIKKRFLTVKKKQCKKNIPASPLVLSGLGMLAYVIDIPIWQPSFGGLSNYLNNQESRK